MKELIVNYGTVFAFAAIAIDLVFQIQRVWSRKSAGDISLWGYVIRFIASFVLFAKYFTLADAYLIGGQAVVVVLHLIYFWLILTYRLPKRRLFTGEKLVE